MEQTSNQSWCSYDICLFFFFILFLVLAVGVHVCCLGLFVLCFGGEGVGFNYFNSL